MPTVIAVLLMQLGCAAQGFTTSAGDGLVVWVCPPVAAEPAAGEDEKEQPGTPA